MCFHIVKLFQLVRSRYLIQSVLLSIRAVITAVNFLIELRMFDLVLLLQSPLIASFKYSYKYLIISDEPEPSWLEPQPELRDFQLGSRPFSLSSEAKIGQKRACNSTLKTPYSLINDHEIDQNHDIKAKSDNKDLGGKNWDILSARIQLEN